MQVVHRDHGSFLVFTNLDGEVVEVSMGRLQDQDQEEVLMEYQLLGVERKDGEAFLIMRNPRGEMVEVGTGGALVEQIATNEPAVAHYHYSWEEKADRHESHVDTEEVRPGMDTQVRRCFGRPAATLHGW